MKYLLIGVFALILAFGVFAYKSNQDDKERLKQTEIAHQQKLEREKLEAEQAKIKATELKAQQELQRIKENEAVIKAEQDKHASQTELATQKVKERLIDGDSAKFRNQMGNCGEVNAKNRMGGYTGFARYIYNPDRDSVAIESDSRDSLYTPSIMDTLWKAECRT